MHLAPFCEGQSAGFWAPLSQSSYLHLADSSVGKESTCNAGDSGSVPWRGRSTGEGIGYPLLYSGLEKSRG